MGYNLLINGVSRGYNPLILKDLLTSVPGHPSGAGRLSPVSHGESEGKPYLDVPGRKLGSMVSKWVFIPIYCIYK